MTVADVSGLANTLFKQKQHTGMRVRVASTSSRVDEPSAVVSSESSLAELPPAKDFSVCRLVPKCLQLLG